jgi:hypothetical protein
MNQAPSPLTPDSKQADPDFRAIVMASLYLAIFLTILGLAYTGNRPGCIGRIRYLDRQVTWCYTQCQACWVLLPLPPTYGAKLLHHCTRTGLIR